MPGGEVIATALSNIVGFRRQRDCQALKAFTACHQELKDAIKRGAELANALTEPALHDLARARKALDSLWPFLQQEPDLGDDDREHADKLADLMAKESFFRELPAIDQHAKALENSLPGSAATGARRAYARRTRRPWNSSTAPPAGSRSPRSSATASPSRWPPTPSPRTANHSIPAAPRRLDACPVRRDKAIEELLRLIDGNRVVKVSASSYFAGGVENEEQLDQALGGLKDQCLELIGAGKKVLVQ